LFGVAAIAFATLNAWNISDTAGIAGARRHFRSGFGYQSDRIRHPLSPSLSAPPDLWR
jgi:hypothetical protein